MSDLTRHLQQTAIDGLSDGAAIAALYDEIRRLARSMMRKERPDHTLVPTALANEAYMRLFKDGAVGTFGTGNEFLAAAVTTLRRILVEHGRRRQRLKRGGDVHHEPADPERLQAADVDDRLLAIDEALQELAAFDPAKARLVELRFFGGLTVDEAATVLDSSPRTVARDWRLVRAFLRSRLGVAGDVDGLDA